MKKSLSVLRLLMFTIAFSISANSINVVSAESEEINTNIIEDVDITNEIDSSNNESSSISTKFSSLTDDLEDRLVTKSKSVDSDSVERGRSRRIISTQLIMMFIVITMLMSDD